VGVWLRSHRKHHQKDRNLFFKVSGRDLLHTVLN
jgi:hypothetical protein